MKTNVGFSRMFVIITDSFPLFIPIKKDSVVLYIYREHIDHSPSVHYSSDL